MTSRPYDAAIVGGGLAGSVSAIHLARRGLRVILLEKAAQAHDKVCGEFLSGEGLGILREAGADPDALGAAVITHVRLHGPRNFARARLPVAGRGLSRARLDSALLELAQERGCEVRRGVTVTGHERAAPDGRHLLLSSDGPVEARHLFVATGKSEFRPLQIRNGRDSGLVGLKVHVGLRAPASRDLAGHVDLFVFEGGYAGLAPVENGMANLCLALEKSLLKSVGADWNRLVALLSLRNGALGDRLLGAAPLASRFATIAPIPYGFVRAERAPEGVYFLGDQLAVIPSLTGDGMAIAMMSARLAVGSLARGADAYQREMIAVLRPRVRLAYWLHRLFRRPRLCDGAFALADRVPAVVDWCFRRTRCPVERLGLAGGP